MSKNKSITFSEVRMNTLFFLPGTGVCRKVHPVQATDKNNKVRVVYPDDPVQSMDHNKKSNRG